MEFFFVNTVSTHAPPLRRSICNNSVWIFSSQSSVCVLANKMKIIIYQMIRVYRIIYELTELLTFDQNGGEWVDTVFTCLLFHLN